MKAKSKKGKRNNVQRTEYYRNGKRIGSRNNQPSAIRFIWLLLKPFRWIVWVLWILFVCIAEASFACIKEGLKEVVLSLVEASSTQGKK